MMITAGNMGLYLQSLVLNQLCHWAPCCARRASSDNTGIQKEDIMAAFRKTK